MVSSHLGTVLPHSYNLQESRKQQQQPRRTWKISRLSVRKAAAAAKEDLTVQKRLLLHKLSAADCRWDTGRGRVSGPPSPKTGFCMLTRATKPPGWCEWLKEVDPYSRARIQAVGRRLCAAFQWLSEL